ncbi:MAG TPA: hypothetical protein VJB41_02140 [Patescibacteria group bacterium]|nr:hypothetical protein [Patescibacteria group bacterium]
MRRAKKNYIFIREKLNFTAIGFLIFFGVIFFAKNGLAVGVTPSTIEAKNLANNLKVEKTVFISRANPANTDLYTVKVSGEGAKYIVLGELTIELPKGEKKVPYTFSIEPKNAPAGDYSAQVVFAGTMPKTDSGAAGNSVGTLSGAAAIVNFSVTNEEVEEFTIRDAQIYESEVGEPIVFSFWIKNDGNVDAKPDYIELEFADETDETNIIKEKIEKTAMEAVAPGAESRVVVSLQSKPEEGRYKGKIVFFDNNKEILRKENLSFVVYPAGTLAQTAELVSFSTNGNQFIPGDLVKFDAVLKNTGEVPVESILAIELEKDGKMIDLLKSEKKSLIKKSEAKFTITFRPEDNGEYQAKAYFEYGIKKTDEKNIKFNVGKVGNVKMMIIILAGAFLVIAAVLIAIFHSRRKKKTNSKSFKKRKK